VIKRLIRRFYENINSCKFLLEILTILEKFNLNDFDYFSAFPKALEIKLDQPFQSVLYIGKLIKNISFFSQPINFIIKGSPQSPLGVTGD